METELHIDNAPLLIAPDGLQVRPLASTERGSMAEFRLAAGLVGRTIQHQTIEEIWQGISSSGTTRDFSMRCAQ